MADSQELADYYTNYYEKEHYEAFNYKNLILNHYHRIAGLKEAQIKKEAKFLKKLGEKTKFLDVGCGLGLGLAYANGLNCELYATELDTGALEFVKMHFDVKTFQGDIWEAKFPENYFDFIHISHVIEHVLDPKAYISEMKRILKPGGHLAIGTPNMSSNLYRFHRWSKLLRMNVPDVIDGLEHTFIFPKKLLKDICEEQGLLVTDHFTYNLGEKLGNLISYKMPLKKKLNRLLQNAFQVNQWIVCKK
ncbi:class I SAM-dependent methyltransferase [Algoriphagus antarcticus]|nr:class I SAM-dependent methyltransferase [Algoriphagus antarcticus]